MKRRRLLPNSTCRASERLSVFLSHVLSGPRIQRAFYQTFVLAQPLPAMQAAIRRRRGLRLR
eukprot:3386122-Pleurochrysis_carterae.AAC.1